MRPDMGKVITERQRTSGHRGEEDKGLSKQHRIHHSVEQDEYDQIDNLPKHEGVMAKHRNNYKSFSDVLGPIRGFLRKNANRPWNKVKSEMQKHIGRNSVSHRHVWSHIEQFVNEHIVEGKDGKLYDRQFGWRRYGMKELIPLDHTNHNVEFFVDPRSGLLRLNKWHRAGGNYRRRQPKAEPVWRIPLGDGVQLEKVKGIWYRCVTVTFPEKLSQQDPVTGCRPEDFSYAIDNWDLVWRMHGNNRTWPTRAKSFTYRRQKKALNHKELKSHKIENDRPEVA